MLTSIFKDNPFIESPNTATELLLYSFLVFIRRQKEKQQHDCPNGGNGYWETPKSQRNWSDQQSINQIRQSNGTLKHPNQQGVQTQRNLDQQNGKSPRSSRQWRDETPRNDKPKQWTLKMIAEDDEVIQLILSVAKYSYETLQRREIIFEALEDDRDMLYAIEKIGLVVKSTKRESGVTIYQFQHLTFQELFAAIHIHRMVHVDRELAASPALRACLTIVCGLEGICCNAAHQDFTSSNKPILHGMLKRLTRKHGDEFSDFKIESLPSTKVLDLLQSSWMSHWTIDVSLNQVEIDISDLFIEAFFESQYSIFPLHLALAEGTSLVFAKEKQASPLTKYPLYRLCHFIHAFVNLHPTVTVKFFPLYSLSFGIGKLETILRRCQTLYLNTRSLVQEEIIHLLTFIYEELYKLQYFKELIINFGFSKLDQFLLDALASVFRFTRLECLHLQSIEIEDKPRLRWPRMLALLQQSIKKHQSLRKLTLHKCGLTDELVLDVTPVFRNLTHIDLSYNGLSQVTLNRILCCRGGGAVDMECLNFSWNQFNHRSTTELLEVKQTVDNRPSRNEHCGVPKNDRFDEPFGKRSSFVRVKSEGGESGGYGRSSKPIFPLIKVLDISQCQTSPLNILEDVLVLNIIKTVQHLRVDRFIAINQFLDALNKLCKVEEAKLVRRFKNNDNKGCENNKDQSDINRSKSEGSQGKYEEKECKYENKNSDYNGDEAEKECENYVITKNECEEERYERSKATFTEDSKTVECQYNQAEEEQYEKNKVEASGGEQQLQAKEIRRVGINLRAIHIVGFNNRDEEGDCFIDIYREKKEQFEKFGIEVNLFNDELTADFLVIPDWFEISHDVS